MTRRSGVKDLVVWKNNPLQRHDLSGGGIVGGVLRRRKNHWNVGVC